MPIATLHVAISGMAGASLDEAARRIYGCLGVDDYGERESSNYPSDRYFRGERDGARFDVSLEDDPGFDEYQFWVTVRLPSDFRAGLQEFLPGPIGALLRCGMQVSRRMFDDPEATSKQIVREIYSLKKDSAGPQEIAARREVIPV